MKACHTLCEQSPRVNSSMGQMKSVVSWKFFNKVQTWNSVSIKTKRISGNQEKKREPIIGIANFTDNKCKSDRRPPPDWRQSGREDRRPFDHQTIRPTPSPGFAFGTDWAGLQERRERFLCSYIGLVNNSGRNRLWISMVNVLTMLWLIGGL